LFIVIHCHTLSYSCHTLSYIVIQLSYIVIHCHTVVIQLSYIVIHCHTVVIQLSYSCHTLSYSCHTVVIHCHTLSYIVIQLSYSCHSIVQLFKKVSSLKFRVFGSLFYVRCKMLNIFRKIYQRYFNFLSNKNY